MPAKNLITENILRPEIDDDGRVVALSFIFDDTEGARHEQIDTDSPYDDVNGKTAIRAYMEYWSLGLYDHPDTDPDGLAFMFATPQVDRDNQQGVYRSVMGYVSQDYNGTKDFGRWPRYKSNDGGWYVPAWAVVNRSVRGKYQLTRTRINKTESTETKGDWLWAAAHRINLTVRTLPFSPWAVSVLETASVDDPEARVEMYWDKYNKARARNQENRAVWQETQEAEVPPTALSVKVGDSFIPLEEEPYQDVLIHYPYGEETHRWDGSVGAKIRFARVSTMQYDCELLG